MRTKSQIERLSLFLTPEQASKISGLGVNRDSPAHGGWAA